MVDGTNIQSDFQSVIDDIGQPIIVTYFTVTYDSDEEDDEPDTFVQSGADVYASGIIQPVKFERRQTPTDTQTNTLLQQGLITMSDKILYIPSGTNLNEVDDLKIQIRIGSPSRDNFSILPNSVSVPTEVDGIFVYQKAYIRRLTTGSINLG